MTPTQVRLQHLASLLVAVTGIVYFVMKYLLTTDDPFAVANHPWQPHVQHLHVLVAPLLVFVTGLVWTRHVAPRWSAQVPRRRASGVAMVLTFAPMVASGYLLQISVEELWRAVWTWVHVATSVLWMAGYAAHILGRRAARRLESGQQGREQRRVG